MKLTSTFKSELLKTKRSSTWILTLVMAAIAPLLILLIFDYDLENDRQVKQVMADPWNFYFLQGTIVINIVFLPMFVVLMSALLPQIEYRNHTWKQVLASPQSFSMVYFSKFIVFQLVIISYLLIHSLLMGFACVLSGIINPEFKFFAHSFNVANYGKLILQTYVSVLALSAFQFYWGIRFKSFLLPIGIGVLCCVMGMINMIGYQVLEPDKVFFNYAAFISIKENVAKIPSVLWMSFAYFTISLAAGFWEFSRAKIS